MIILIILYNQSAISIHQKPIISYSIKENKFIIKGSHSINKILNYIRGLDED